MMVTPKRTSRYRPHRSQGNKLKNTLWRLLLFFALIANIRSDDDFKPPSYVYELPWWHPGIDYILRNRIAGPANHPTLNNLSSFQSYIRLHTDEEHDFFDGSNGYVQRPRRLPGDHPAIDPYIAPAAKPSNLEVTLPVYHPDVGNAFSSGTPLPSDHPSVEAMYSNNLPEGHPNVDEIFSNPNGYTIPNWHPALNDMVLMTEAPSFDPFTLPAYHPNVEDNFNKGVPIPSIPNDHPSVQSMYVKILPEGHPNVDDIFTSPADYTLPNWHPTWEELMVTSDLPPVDPVTLPAYHPDVEESFNKGVSLPNDHPSVQTMYAANLPEGHPNIDDIFNSPKNYALPDWHPTWKELLLPTDILPFDPVVLPAYHPNIEDNFNKGVSIPSIPNDHPSVQSIYSKLLPNNHPNVDDIFTNPADYTLPDWHPTWKQLAVEGKAAPITPVPLPSWHPDIEKAYERGDTLPEDHPVVDDLMDLPAGHGSVDVYFNNPKNNPIPSNHPKLSLLVTYDASSFPTTTLPFNHPKDFSDYQRREPIDDHPSVHYLFVDKLPENHPNIDDLLKNPQPLPDWHPPIDQLVEVRNLWYAPGTIFTLAVLAILLLTWAVRSLRKAMKRSQQKGAISNDKETSDDTTPLTEAPQAPEESADDALQFSPETLPHRRWILHQAVTLNAEHHDDALGYEIISPSLKRYIARVAEVGIDGNADSSQNSNDNEVNGAIEEKKKQTTFHAYSNKLFHGRLANSHWSTGNAFICTIYLFLNAVCVVIFGVAGLYPYDVGIGTLAAANLIFLIMVATRNSLLTWCLGIAFDHIILYHRFIGRVTIVLGIVHAAFYVDKFNTDAIGTKTFVSGIVALVCGLGIGATTTNWMRRNHFNIFFWTHYLFVGFFAGVFLHAPGAVPYVALATVLFVIDKVLRIVWTLLPQKTTVFRTRSESTAQVQFPKNFLVRMMGRHKVGQYCFVNFPELSKMEWHPFSVSSSPDDPYIELHIRNLGDHTKRIVEYAKECAETNRQVLIRSDGPYGNLNFNYRRYDKLFLVGGGIGVTPIIGILKDLYCYSDNDYNDSKKKKRKAHRIEKVRLVWVMPRASEAALFLDMLLQFSMSAREDPGLPELKLSIHCTREEEGNARPPIVTARPNFPSLLRDVMYYNGSETSEESMSTLVFACGPKGMVNQLWDESKKMNTKHSRVDFHHEVFEF